MKKKLISRESLKRLVQEYSSMQKFIYNRSKGLKIGLVQSDNWIIYLTYMSGKAFNPITNEIITYNLNKDNELLIYLPDFYFWLKYKIDYGIYDDLELFNRLSDETILPSLIKIVGQESYNLEEMTIKFCE